MNAKIEAGATGTASMQYDDFCSVYRGNLYTAMSATLLDHHRLALLYPQSALITV